MKSSIAVAVLNFCLAAYLVSRGSWGFASVCAIGAIFGARAAFLYWKRVHVQPAGDV